MWEGPEKAKLAVVAGKMPAQTTPFSGPAGQMFRAALTTANIPVGKVAFGFDGRSVIPAVVSLEAKFLVLAGDQALSRFRPDLRVRQCHGRPFMLQGTLEGTLGFPVFHPEAYWRNPRWRPLLAAELGSLLALGRAPDEWRSFVPDSCVKCRGLSHMVDADGVVYCEEHAP